jgi:uncharacterized protein
VLSRRKFLALGGATAAAMAASTGLYSWLVEPYWMEIVQQRMPLENLPDQLVGKTLLQISDIHVGPRVSSEYLIRSFRAARELAPDFVAITGDFVSYANAREAEDLARVLQSLPLGRLATVGSLGNHDYGQKWGDTIAADRVSRVATDAGVQMLRNETRVVDGLQLSGLADYWSPEFGGRFARGRRGEALAAASRGITTADPDAATTIRALEPGLPTVVLSHNPDVQDLPIWEGVRGWMLAGHTHGGQVRAPFLPPPILPVQNRRYTAGVFDVGPGRTMYVNRGLGFMLQVRFNVRPELTLFTLERASTPRA